jgi:predicted nucleotidyltransferase
MIEALRRHAPSLAECYPIKSLGLFGSYVRDEQRPGSDLDLLVEFTTVPSLLTFIELEQSLSDLLGVNVDLVMRDALKPEIGRHILDELVPV